MKWFSIKGIREEIRKIEWPKRKEMFKYTVTVLGFVLFFAGFFSLSEVVISAFLKLVGVFG